MVTLKLFEWFPTKRLKAISAPKASATKPTQSPVVHLWRQRFAGSLPQAVKRSASPNANGMSPSWPRTNGATALAAIAEANHQTVLCRSALAISRKQSAAQG